MTQRIVTIDTSYTGNPAPRNDRIDYRALKKELNKYYKFGFKMPRKGQDFNPQQKTVLRKRLAEIKDYIDNRGDFKRKEVSFIKYNKKVKKSDLKNLDAIKTNKGLIYKYPNAKAVVDPETKKPRIVVVPKDTVRAYQAEKRFEELFLFPRSIVNDPEKIQKFVDQLREKYGPDDIRFSTRGKRESVRYDSKFFEFYFSLFYYDEPEEVPEEIIEEYDEQGMPLSDREVWRARKVRETMDARPDFYNGVFLVYYIPVGATRPKRKRAKKKK